MIFGGSYLPLLLLGLLLAREASCKSLPKNQICISALINAYSSLTFEGPETYYGSACQSPYKVASLYASCWRYCDQDAVDAGIAYWEDTCHRYGKVDLISQSAVAENLTDKAIAAMPLVEQGEIPLTEVLNKPVMISKFWFDVSYRTVYVFQYETWTHETYGFAMYGFWGGILLIGIIHRIWSVFFYRRLARSVSDVENGAQGRGKSASSSGALLWISTSYDWVKTYVIVPSTFDSYRRRLLWWSTIPTRMEFLVIGSFYIINFVLCFVNYEVFLENTYYPGSIPMQLSRYISDRTGIISYANLSWMWIFAGRNNIFIWATGWQFSTFNLFHRHVARIATIQAIVHSIGYTAFFYIEDPTWAVFKEDFKETWFWTGVLATITMSLILLFSVSWLRVKLYESFLLIHIVFSIMTLVGLFYHTSIYTGDYDPYLWAPSAIWCFDRFVRIVRTVYCTLHVNLSKGRNALTHAHAEVSYQKDANMLIVRLSLKDWHLKPRAGEHYYLYQPFHWAGWENHPFTLGYWETNASSPSQPSQPYLVSSDMSCSKEAQVHQTSPAQATSQPPTPPSSSSAASISAATVQGMKLEFWIRPFNGWTRRLRTACLRSPGGAPIRPTILLEGPYGHCEPLHAYEKVLLIAGGAGVTSVTGYLLDHAERASSSSSSFPVSSSSSSGNEKQTGDGENGVATTMNTTTRTRTRDVHLVWVDRSEALLRGIPSLLGGEVLAAALARPEVRAEFFVTGGGDEAKNVEGEVKKAGGDVELVRDDGDKSSDGDSGKAQRNKGMTITRGRPDIAGLVEDAAKEGWEMGWRVAVLVCGPDGMSDATREAVSVAMRKYGKTVDYFEEAFGW